jgi:hypothetical protein
VQQDDIAAVKPPVERSGRRGFALGALTPRTDISWLAGQRCHE